MKIKLDIDCTPEEARKFFGLPDVEPMQKALMQQMQDRISENINQLDPENMMKIWMPQGMQGFDQMQNMFWNAMSGNKSEDK